jgi:hypothetical protein
MRKKPKFYYHDSRPGNVREFDRDQRIQRARILDRLADLELQVGHHRAGECLSNEAAELRECAR